MPYPSPSFHLYEDWHWRTTCGFVKVFVAQMVVPKSPQHSAGRWDETHPICWDQLVSPSTFQHHTTVQTSRLSSECAAWSSDLQILWSLLRALLASARGLLISASVSPPLSSTDSTSSTSSPSIRMWSLHLWFILSVFVLRSQQRRW